MLGKSLSMLRSMGQMTVLVLETRGCFRGVLRLVEQTNEGSKAKSELNNFDSEAGLRY
jgi:hypothetical protein